MDQPRVWGTADSYPQPALNAWLPGAAALAIGVVGLFLADRKPWIQKSPELLFLFVFPAMGIALLGWAMVSQLRQRNYSGSFFEMGSLPFFLGQTVCGTIHARVGRELRQPVELSLSCVRRTRSVCGGAGGMRTGPMVFDELVWRDKSSANPLPSPGSDWVTVPVQFSLPSDAPVTARAIDATGSILWMLKASAKLRGIDFVQVFEVPVFSSSDSENLPQPADNPSRFSPISVSLPDKPSSRAPQVLIRTCSDGSVEFLFSPKGHWSIAVGATLAFCFWTLLIRYFFWTSDALSLSIFVLGDLLLLYWAIWSWFSKSSALFHNGTVSVQQSIFGFGKTTNVSYKNIQQITSPITRQSGQGTEAIAFYDIDLQTASRGTIRVAGSIKDANEAGHIVSRMKALVKGPGK